MANIPIKYNALKVELTRAYGDGNDSTPYKRYISKEDIFLTSNHSRHGGRISNLAVTVFKPFKRTPNEIEPENIIVVSFDILGVSSFSGTENGDELAPSIFISFSTNQEVHPEKTTPLIKGTEDHLHIYSEHRIKPIVFYELYSETLQVYFQMTSGTLYIKGI